MNSLIIFLSLLVSGNLLAQDTDSDSSLQARCSQEGYACGACEENLQNDFNQILDNLTVEDLSTSHWGNLRDDLEAEGSNLTFKNPMPPYNDVLQNIINVMRDNNNGQLNWVSIGESESLQQTSVDENGMNPRIMLKSPNSELMVTFSTDPSLPGYNSIEIMRWNGRQGRYEFQEINFGDQGEAPHIDLSGRKCMACHKEPSMRPNWDTYRAWAGVVPSRDDMLEMHHTSTEVEDEYYDDGTPVIEFNIDRTRPAQPDARAYLGFLDQVAAAQSQDSNARDSRAERIAMLDIPFDQEDQLTEAISAFQAENGEREITPQERVEMIRRQVDQEGFYRIRHHPDLYDDDDGSLAFNFDNKGALAAGPSQFAFDQMQGQNMCRIATDLSQNENFDKFKYALTAIAQCGQENLPPESYLPSSFMQRSAEFFKGRGRESFVNSTPEELANLAEATPREVLELINNDISNNQNLADGFKRDRHYRFLESFMRDAEGLSPEQVSADAAFYSAEVTAPTRLGARSDTGERYFDREDINWHAITDHGGVDGVPEPANHRTMMSNMRFLLEPYGVDMSQWSLVNGRDAGYNSYSFSDQFVLLAQQRLFQDIFAEVRSELEQTTDNGVTDDNICNELLIRSQAALDEATLPSTDFDERSGGLVEQFCATQFDGSFYLPIAEDDIIQTTMAASAELLEEEAINIMETSCVGCHSSGDHALPGMIEFIELTRMEFEDEDVDSRVDREAQKAFADYLNEFREVRFDQSDPKRQVRLYEYFQYKLGLHGETPMEFGNSMPRMSIPGNEEFARSNNMSTNEAQNQRRQLLGNYITAVAQNSVNGVTEWQLYCARISNGTRSTNEVFEQNTPQGTTRSVIRE